MSQTVSMDPYLAGQTAPQQEIKLDPQYGSVRMWTPVGRLAYATLAKARSSTPPGAAQPGPPQFSCTILLNPNTCQDLYRAIAMVANARWPSEKRPNPQNPSEMIDMTGEQMLFLPKERGGLHYPLRQGDEAYMREPAKYEAYRGLFQLNTSIEATNRKSGNSQQPVCVDEAGHLCDPAKFYSGCYGRLQVTLFAFPKAGVQGPNRGIGVSLQAAQFAQHGEKLSSFDAGKSVMDSVAKLGALPAAQPQPGYGPNTATPGSVPGGVAAPAGFAAPPPPQQGQPQPNWAPPGQQQAWTPAPGGARPPGT